MLNYLKLNAQLYRFVFFIICVFFTSLQVQASAGGVVFALQMPAWLVRDEIKKPLKPGMEINNNDSIITGAHARVLIHLAEGSLFKIGENTEVILNTLQAAVEKDGFFEGDIEVTKGAFRFTTSKLAALNKRKLNIHIGSITTRIKGTDIWGRSLNGEDNLVLIEGEIETNRSGEPEFEMRQSLSWYHIAKNQPGKIIQTIPQDQLATWAAETELLSGGGVISIDGHWVVNLMSLRDKKTLNQFRLKLAHKGYANSVKEIKIKGKQWHRLQIKGFESQADAKIFAQSIEVSHGFKRPWIVRF